MFLKLHYSTQLRTASFLQLREQGCSLLQGFHPVHELVIQLAEWRQRHPIGRLGGMVKPLTGLGTLTVVQRCFPIIYISTHGELPQQQILLVAFELRRGRRLLIKVSLGRSVSMDHCWKCLAPKCESFLKHTSWFQTLQISSVMFHVTENCVTYGRVCLTYRIPSYFQQKRRSLFCFENGHGMEFHYVEFQTALHKPRLSTRTLPVVSVTQLIIVLPWACTGCAGWVGVWGTSITHLSAGASEGISSTFWVVLRAFWCSQDADTIPFTVLYIFLCSHIVFLIIGE